MNYEAQQILQHHLSLYLKILKTRKHPNIAPYFKKFCTRNELIEVIQWMLDGVVLEHLCLETASMEELWETIDDDCVLLEYNLEKWKTSLKSKEGITTQKVWNTLEQLNLRSHYLGVKYTTQWDAYDLSNYRSLQLKAGCVQKMYGIFDIAVSQEQVHQVTTKPFRYYKQEAITYEILEKLIQAQHHQKDNLHVLYVYKAV